MKSRRRALLIAAVVALGPVLAACSGGGGNLGAHGEISPTGQRVPATDLTGSLVTGGSFTLASLRGKVVVLNAFGSWCGPCQEETPTLQQAYADSLKKGEAVSFVGLDERDTQSEVLPFLAKNMVTYPVVNDDEGKLLASLKNSALVSSLPGTLVLDRQGRIAARFVGQVIYTQIMQTVSTLAAEPA